MSTRDETPGPRPTEDDVRRLVELACRAPSVHNTQPWRWHIDDWRPADWRITLRADPGRQLPSSDPVGRNLVLSCGAALHHLAVAAAGTGHRASVLRLPDPADPDLLAVVELAAGPAPTPDDVALLAALRSRVTDRRRFTTWPVPEQRLDALAAVVDRWGTRVTVLTSPVHRLRVEGLVDRAREVQRTDPGCRDELRRWVGGDGRDDGVPRAALPLQAEAGERQDRFDRMIADEVAPATDPADGVLAICTSHDDVPAWLDAGEALSALWLHATATGLSVVPLSQVVEVPETRQALRHDLFADMAHPQLLLRVGWQATTRAPMAPTPRRPLGDVLDP